MTVVRAMEEDLLSMKHKLVPGRIIEVQVFCVGKCAGGNQKCPDKPKVGKTTESGTTIETYTCPCGG
jgi:hypothetical protein